MSEAQEEIQLILPEEEVEASEADVLQEPEDQVQTDQEDELEQYSEGVKKSIDKLTYRMREAERQRDEAVEVAKKIAEQNNSLQTRLTSSDDTLVDQYAARVNAEKEQARKNLQEAQELGNAEAITLATEALAKVSFQEQNAQNLVKKRKNAVQETPQQTVQRNIQPAVPDPRAEEWAENNPWFGEDEGMTFAAMGIHQKLVGEGVPVSSKHYYARVDEEMRNLFPDRISGEEPNVKSTSPVAGASRGAGAVKKGPRSVKLTPSQIAIAKRIGVPIEEYAKYV